MKTLTHLNRYEARAYQQRRELVEAGVSVSPITFNAAQDAYVFDSYPTHELEKI